MSGFAVLDAPRRARRGFADQLDALTSPWGGIADVVILASPGAIAAVASCPEVAERALAILRETTANAINHGRATEVQASLALDSNGDISLHVTDNGLGILPSATAGSGARMLARVVPDWTIRNDEQGAVLTATITTRFDPLGLRALAS